MGLTSAFREFLSLESGDKEVFLFTSMSRTPKFRSMNVKESEFRPVLGPTGNKARLTIVSSKPASKPQRGREIAQSQLNREEERLIYRNGISAILTANLSLWRFRGGRNCCYNLIFLWTLLALQTHLLIPSAVVRRREELAGRALPPSEDRAYQNLR